MAEYPFILIFDIDRTLIGNVNLSSFESQLLIHTYNLCKKNGLNNCKFIENINMQTELQNGLLRPYINEFIQFCENKYKNVEIFFYTGSSYGWTNLSLGNNIEKALNKKINRPFFTRENMLGALNEKSLANIFPHITKTLISKYPIMKNEKELDYIINKRSIFIDDVYNNTYTYNNRQIVCPEYNGYHFYDISEKIIREYGIPREVFNNKEILRYMWDYNLPIYNIHGNVFQRSEDLFKLQIEIEKKKSVLSKIDDRFYKDLIFELSKNKKVDNIISNKTIENINNKLTNRDYTI